MPAILLLFLFLFFPLNSAKAITPINPYTIKFQSFTPPPTKKPVFPTSLPSTNPNITEPPGEDNPNVFFSQVDPRWRNYPHPDPENNLGYCGCGETVAAMILSRFIDNSGKYTPPKMWDYYEQSYPGRCGTSLESHVATMQAYGLKASIHAYSNNQVLSNYLASDYTIFLHYKRPTTSYGHYVLIDSVNGNNIKVYNPAHLPGSLQPVPLETGAMLIDYITIKK